MEPRGSAATGSLPVLLGRTGRIPLLVHFLQHETKQNKTKNDRKVGDISFLFLDGMVLYSTTSEWSIYLTVVYRMATSATFHISLEINGNLVAAVQCIMGSVSLLTDLLLRLAPSRSK